MDDLTEIYADQEQGTDLDVELATAGQVLQKLAEEQGVDLDKLSDEDVADLLARGADPACIARTLGISLDTVRTHLKHVYRKTNTHSQCDVVRLMLASSAHR